MTTHHASCSCEQLRLTAEGDPIRVSVCHCLSCQRRTGSAFGVQARFDPAQVTIEGRHTDYVRISDEGDERVFSFCPECGGTVFYRIPELPEMIAVPVGAFADPTFQPPVRSVWEVRRHPWVELLGELERDG